MIEPESGSDILGGADALQYILEKFSLTGAADVTGAAKASSPISVT